MRPIKKGVEEKKWYDEKTGRKGYSPVTLLKGLLLEQWYGLSDLELEEELSDQIGSGTGVCGDEEALRMDAGEKF